MKKGFTLIELLAVIVILAIIALIATPTILGVVENAKKGAAEQSANGYIEAINNQISLNLIDDDETNDIVDDIYDVPLEDFYKVKVKGNKPLSGWVEVTKNGINRYSIVIGNYVISYDGNDKTVTKGNEPQRVSGMPYLAFSSGTVSSEVGESFETLKSSINYKYYVNNNWQSYLKYLVDENNIIKKISACGFANNKKFCIEGGDDGLSFKTNVNKLLNAFGSQHCSNPNSTQDALDCEFGDIDAHAIENGNVIVGIGNFDNDCIIDEYSSFRCD